MSAIKRTQKLGAQWVTQDPFLFCAHHHDKYPVGNENQGPKADLTGRNIGQDFASKDGWNMYHGQTVPGFPYHPHRGFETITVVEKGFADHSDSLGATGRFGEGDVQWMTAGNGVQHSEMFPLRKQEEENELLLFQIWLNLPKKSKGVPANYKMLWHEDIPVNTSTDANGNKTTVKVMAGDYGETQAPEMPPHSWAAEKDNEVAVWLIKMEQGAEWKLPAASAEANRSLFFYKGATLLVNDEVVQSSHGLDVEANVELELKAIGGEAHILLLQGKPLNEPVVQHGPFVMNTRQEIMDTFAEYQRTQFGGWPWPAQEMVHPREKGRFAQYPDGTVEERA